MALPDGTQWALKYADPRSDSKVLIYLPKDMHRDARVLAWSQGISVSELIRRQLTEVMARSLQTNPLAARSLRGKPVREVDIPLPLPKAERQWKYPENRKKRAKRVSKTAAHVLKARKKRAASKGGSVVLGGRAATKVSSTKSPVTQCDNLRPSHERSPEALGQIFEGTNRAPGFERGPEFITVPPLEGLDPRAGNAVGFVKQFDGAKVRDTA